jgi:DNA-binding response OmpR family regulator
MYMTTERPTILVVEDDRATRTFLADNLSCDGFDLLDATCVADAQRMLTASGPDLAIVDLGLPDRDGLELVDWIRHGHRSRADVGADPGLPVIVLSGRASELDRVRGLRRGADDYLVKPFSYEELRARIAALLWRTRGRRREDRLRVAGLVIDPAARKVWLHGESVTLSNKEFALLHALATDPERVFTREELLCGVWGFKVPGPTRTIDSHACRLRQKLAIRGEKYVHNVWGIGYRLLDGASG